MRGMNKFTKIKNLIAVLLILMMTFNGTITAMAEDDANVGTESAPVTVAETVSVIQDAVDEVVADIPEEERKYEDESGQEAGVEVDLREAEAILTEEDTAGDETTTTEGHYESAVENKAEADTNIAAIETETQNFETAMTNEASAIEEYNAADTKGTDYSNDTIADAEVANTTSDYDDAVAARDSAVANLSVAEEGLEEATTAYEKADEEYGKAETAYNNAVADLEKAENQVAAAKAAIAEAGNDAANAKKALEEAQKKVDALEKEVEAAAEKKDDLQSIKDQYYSLLVQYYTEFYGNKINNYYDEDGHLDTDKCAEGMTDEAINKKAINGSTPVFKLGRDLMKKLIEYKILNNENIDPETANLVIGTVNEKGTVKQESREGVIYTDANGLDKVVIDSKSPDGKVSPNAPEYMYWYKGSGQNGRDNRIVVTYTDKNGVEHREYYNYVFKQDNGEGGKYHDGLDIENGPVFLAQITIDDKGNRTVTRVVDSNNMDNYKVLNSELGAAMEAAANLQKYKDAQAAVKAAADKVAELEGTFLDLQNELNTYNEKLGGNKAALALLEQRLNATKTELEATKEKKAALEEKVEEARKAVAGIDLSRFNPSPAPTPAPAPATDPETPADPATPAVVTPVVVTPVAVTPAAAPVNAAVAQNVTAPAANAGQNVLTAQAGNDDQGDDEELIAEIPDEEVALAEAPVTEKLTPEKEVVTPSPVKEIEDEETARAAEIKLMGYNYFWLLLLLILAICIKKTYDNLKKAEEE